MGFAVLGGYLTPSAITFWDFFSVNSQLRVQFKNSNKIKKVNCPVFVIHRTPFICSSKGLTEHSLNMESLEVQEESGWKYIHGDIFRFMKKQVFVFSYRWFWNSALSASDISREIGWLDPSSTHQQEGSSIG
ncbi:uncharacterized protein LOC108952327 [Musa acuminata AAA Group]|uniref:uncharacterized protein LOC108952327 n=1 Tax=Musa acuminata AAA Group TaxID=214697 RepID=UPI0008A0F104|nr:PREDICTED: uncharacterized protein LOC108952327 [Musa acuminata subsp. malaccensis]